MDKHQLHNRNGVIKRSDIFQSLSDDLSEFIVIIHTRLLAWRGIFLVGELVLLFFVEVYFYVRIHGFDFSSLFGLGKLVLPTVSFIPGDGFLPIAVEVMYWSSVAVLVKRFRASAEDAKAPDFDLIRYFGEAVAEWISVPIMATFVVFFLRIFKVNLGQGIDLSLATADIGVIIALSFLLGYFSEDITPILKRFRVHVAIRAQNGDTTEIAVKSSPASERSFPPHIS